MDTHSLALFELGDELAIHGRVLLDRSTNISFQFLQRPGQQLRRRSWWDAAEQLRPGIMMLEN